MESRRAELQPLQPMLPIFEPELEAPKTDVKPTEIHQIAGIADYDNQPNATERYWQEIGGGLVKQSATVELPRATKVAPKKHRASRRVRDFESDLDHQAEMEALPSDYDDSTPKATPERTSSVVESIERQLLRTRAAEMASDPNYSMRDIQIFLINGDRRIKNRHSRHA